MEFNVKYINPFLQGATEVIKQVCNLQLKMEKPFIRNEMEIDDCIAIIIGMTGQVQGQIMITMQTQDALKIVSLMMMKMPVSELDDMAVSAISELGNMIMGTTSTIFANSGILTDITPPALLKGKIIMKQAFGTIISVPLVNYSDNLTESIKLTLDIALKEK
jgi:chemotaxis protein CheX